MCLVDWWLANLWGRVEVGKGCLGVGREGWGIQSV